MKSSSISKRDVQKIASLAKINLTSQDEVDISKQLNTILEYFREIGEVDTDGVSPTYHVLDLFNVFRSDEPRSFPAQKIMKIIPQKRGKFVRSPRIM